ncbi:unnamed protein product [Arctogadus glacialis]
MKGTPIIPKTSKERARIAPSAPASPAPASPAPASPPSAPASPAPASPPSAPASPPSAPASPASPLTPVSPPAPLHAAPQIHLLTTRPAVSSPELCWGHRQKSSEPSVALMIALIGLLMYSVT